MMQMFADADMDFAKVNGYIAGNIHIFEKQERVWIYQWR